MHGRTWYRTFGRFSTLALLTPLLLATPAIADPGERDRSHGRDQRAPEAHKRGHERTARPQAAPPPPRAERTPRNRKHQVWIAGNWQWRNGQWRWTDGAWARRRPGQQRQVGTWQPQPDGWVYSGDVWSDWSLTPTSAPPPSPVERNRARRGQTWIAGHWEWSYGAWQWQPGRARWTRRGHTLQPGLWQQRDNAWTWQADAWVPVSGVGATFEIHLGSR